MNSIIAAILAILGIATPVHPKTTETPVHPKQHSTQSVTQLRYNIR
jgi:hypothetical protein